MATLIDLFPAIENTDQWYVAECLCGWTSFEGSKEVTINYAVEPHLEERHPRMSAKNQSLDGWYRLVTEW